VSGANAASEREKVSEKVIMAVQLLASEVRTRKKSWPELVIFGRREDGVAVSICIPRTKPSVLLKTNVPREHLHALVMWLSKRLNFSVLSTSIAYCKDGSMAFFTEQVLSCSARLNVNVLPPMFSAPYISMSLKSQKRNFLLGLEELPYQLGQVQAVDRAREGRSQRSAVRQQLY